MNKCEKLDGFTLVEVMISVIVLMIGISASLATISTAMQRAAAAENKMESIHTARQHIERLRADDIGFNSSYLQDGPHMNSSLGFSYRVNDDPSNSDLKTVTIYTPWIDHVRGRTVTTEVATIFSRVRK